MIIRKLLAVVFLSYALCGCGVLLIDVPIKVPLKGQEKFVYKKYKTLQDMYIVKYPKQLGYYMYSQFDPATIESATLIPKGSILEGMHITRINGWPNGIFYQYVARLEDWKIFQPPFVAQTKMDTNLFHQLDPEFFEMLDK